MTDDSLNELSAKEARRRIGTKEISPVELLEACIERIDQIDPELMPSARVILIAQE